MNEVNQELSGPASSFGNSIPGKQWPSDDIRNRQSLGRLLHQSAQATPDKAALICEDETVSYQTLDRATDTLAHWLLQRGLKSGDRVALHWGNSIDLVKLYFACFKAGLIAVPVNNVLTADEIAYILQDSGAKICFSHPKLASVCEAACLHCPALQRIYKALPELDAMQEETSSLPAILPDRIAAIMYTSGTTANPKGAVHSHASLTSASRLMYSLGFDDRQTPLVMTQLVHVAALGAVLLPGLFKGNTVVVLSAFSAERALFLIERWGCSYFFILPTMLGMIIEEQIRHPRVVNSVRFCMAGGDSVPVTLQEKFTLLFGVPVREVLGMTESLLIACNRHGKLKQGSVGMSLAGVRTRVRGLNASIVADGQVGELQLQSPANCLGYWENPEATAAIFNDGWLRTGDLVRRDSEGFIWFEGRVKQIIVRDSMNISPQAVEEAFYHHPAVRQAGVIGVPDSVRGQKVVAFVSLREGMIASEYELQDWAQGRIAQYKVPERIIVLPSLPEGATGKVNRRLLETIARGHPSLA